MVQKGHIFIQVHAFLYIGENLEPQMRNGDNQCDEYRVI